MQKKEKTCMRKWLYIMPCFLLLVFSLALPCVKVNASWVDRGGSSIYGGEDSEEGSMGQGLGSIHEDGAAENKEMDEGSGFFAELVNTILCWILSTIGNTLFSLLDLIGASLDHLIYGRLVAENTLFTFDLSPGNIYGIVGAAIFNIIRSVTVTGLLVVFTAKLIQSTWKKGDLAKAGLKEAFGSLLLSLMLLALMPNFLDLALYIRDVILYTIGTEGASALFGTKSATSILSVLAAAAGENIISGVIYIAAILLNLYFILGYVGIALSMTTDFILFPLVVLKASYDRQALSNWVWEMIACMCVPIIDAVLIMIPSFLGIYESTLSLGSSVGVSIVQLIICYLIIPARSAARSILGLRTNPLENAGLSAATVLGIAAARGIGNAFSAARESKKNAELDRERAHAEEDLAQLEDEAGEAYEGIGGKTRRDEPLASMDEILKRKKGEQGDDMAFGASGEKEDGSPFGKEQSYADALKSHIQAAEDELTPEELAELPHLANEQALNAKKRQGLDAEIADLEGKKAELEKKRESLMEDGAMDAEEKEGALASINQAIADADGKLQNLKASREAVMSVEEKLRAANERKSQLEAEYQDALKDPGLGETEREERLDAIHERMAKTDHEISGLQRQKQGLKAMQEKEILKAEPSVLREELSALTTSMEELGTQKAALARERSCLKERQGEFMAGTKEYQALEGQIQGLDKQIAANELSIGSNAARQADVRKSLKQQEAGLRDRQAYNLQERVQAQNQYAAAKERAAEIEQALADMENEPPSAQNALKRKNLNRDLHAARQQMGESKRRLGEISGEERRIAERLRETSPEFGTYTQEDYKNAENRLRAAKSGQAVRRAQIQREIAEEQMKMEGCENMEERQVHRARIAALHSDAADCGVKSAQIDQALEELRQYSQAQVTGGSIRMPHKNTGGRSSSVSLDESYSARRRAVMERYANIDNFEAPEFADISHEKRAQLYRERAMRTQQILSRRRLGGILGGTAGGALGLWLGAPGVGIGIMAGRSIGAEAGENAAVRYAFRHSAARPADYSGRPLEVHIASDLRDNTQAGQLRTLEHVQAKLSASLQTDQFERAVAGEFSAQDMLHGEIQILFKKHGVNPENYGQKRNILLSELRPLTEQHVMEAEKRIVRACAGAEYASLSETVQEHIAASIVKPDMDIFYDLCESVYLRNDWQPHYKEYLDD